MFKIFILVLLKKKQGVCVFFCFKFFFGLAVNQRSDYSPISIYNFYN